MIMRQQSHLLPVNRRILCLMVRILIISYNETWTSFLVAIVNENEPIGSFVVWYSVSDLDLDLNGETDIRIEPAGLFSLVKRDGLIVTKAVFDREERENYELTVIACDRGQPKRYGMYEL